LEFEWDEAKNSANYAKHGIRFEDAVGIFSNFVVRSDDLRTEYGEVRRRNLGRTGLNVIMMVISTDRVGRSRIISARRASRKERNDYEQAHQARTQSE
jgi:uncharacterized protein